VAQGLPPLENGLVGEGLNEPPNSQGCNQCGIIMHTHKGRGSIKVEWNSRRREYATVIRECSKERQSFTKGIEARGSNTTITTPTPDVSRRPRENLHQAAQGLPHWQMVWWVKGLMNHPILKATTNVGLLHTHKGERQY
jgi:hypothetical protein